MPQKEVRYSMWSRHGWSEHHFCVLVSSNFWNTEKINPENQETKETKETVETISTKEKALDNEFNPGVKIRLQTKAINKSFFNNYDNNNGRINYNGELKSISRFTFSKIDNFYQYYPKILF